MGKRNLSLRPRNENIKEQKPIQIPIRFELKEIKEHFDESLLSIKSQYIVADQLKNSEKTNECEYIWRSQIVFLEGILDFFLHEISKYALYQMFLCKWEKTEGYKKLMIPMGQVEEAIYLKESKEWFYSYLNDRFSRDVFLSEVSMHDQLNLIGISFTEIMKRSFVVTDSNIRDKPKHSIKIGKCFIQDLFQRRNRIVHQVDRSHESAEVSNIDKQYVEECIEKVTTIVEEIHKIAIEKDSNI